MQYLGGKSRIAKPIAAALNSPATFWDEMRDWSARGALVFVSEYRAPDDWHAVWEGTPRASLAGGDRGRVTERLFTLAPKGLTA